MNSILNALFDLQDTKYRDFHSGLIPTISRDQFIGVRTPAVRALAKQLKGSADAEAFLEELPHRYYDENMLHAMLISEIRDWDLCVRHIERFLPYIDNWAVCDQLKPKVLKKSPKPLLPYIESWLTSSHLYTVRFAIGSLMSYFLDDLFDPVYLEMAAGIQSEEYYVNMMSAWYFATALAKQYDAAIPYLTEHRLSDWVHLKTIQKALESRRISEEQKLFLKSLRH